MFRSPLPESVPPLETPSTGAALPAASSTSYGVEVLRADRWRPVRGFMGLERRYATLDAATAAAVAYWQRTGHACRPFSHLGQD